MIWLLYKNPHAAVFADDKTAIQALDRGGPKTRLLPESNECEMH